MASKTQHAFVSGYLAIWPCHALEMCQGGAVFFVFESSPLQRTRSVHTCLVARTCHTYSSMLRKNLCVQVWELLKQHILLFACCKAWPQGTHIFAHTELVVQLWHMRWWKYGTRHMHCDPSIVCPTAHALHNASPSCYLSFRMCASCIALIYHTCFHLAHLVAHAPQIVCVPYRDCSELLSCLLCGIPCDRWPALQLCMHPRPSLALSWPTHPSRSMPPSSTPAA